MWLKRLSKLLRKPHLALHIITQNRAESLKWVLDQSSDFFDVVRVCDGGSTDDTKQVIANCGAQYYYRKWDDQYHEQDNVLLRQCRPGDWVMIMDDDECPSWQLLNHLRPLVVTAQHLKFNMISLPALDELDGVLSLPVEQFISEVESGARRPFRKLWLFQYDWSVNSYGTPHRSVETVKRWWVYHQPYPYIHRKSSLSFLVNDCIHAWINPSKQGYTEAEAKEMYAVLPKFQTSREILPWLEKEAGAAAAFIRFAEKYKDCSKPIRNWWASYQELYGTHVC